MISASGDRQTGSLLPGNYNMEIQNMTNVELTFQKRSGRTGFSTKTPYLVVDNFPSLGLLTSLRFLEWVSENPEGLISLPT
ncbi:MAG: hypothetical protein GX876_07080, partial [Bacteroidales bacterium]|nr:hypothetical protein [Bacteroidales bacterium]